MDLEIIFTLEYVHFKAIRPMSSHFRFRGSNLEWNGDPFVKKKNSIGGFSRP